MIYLCKYNSKKILEKCFYLGITEVVSSVNRALGRKQIRRVEWFKNNHTTVVTQKEKLQKKNEQKPNLL